MCSFLIPGQKPYYRLAVDGKFTGTPKMARNGCWEEKEEFRPAFKRGIVNLYMYYSPDGNAGEPVPVRFSHRDLKGREASIVVPMIPNQAKDPEMARLDNLFNYSSNGGVKVSQPVLLPGN
ncbi:MAG: hypothetical protein HZA02_03750 [Nitrospinae bacterium]|nr:hypothetical protein [Nitrospinota bacterium]